LVQPCSNNVTRTHGGNQTGPSDINVTEGHMPCNASLFFLLSNTL
jgi:hypothetical protein